MELLKKNFSSNYKKLYQLESYKLTLKNPRNILGGVLDDNFGGILQKSLHSIT